MSMENKFVRHLIYLGQRKTASNIVNFVDMVLQHSISNCKTDFQYQMCSSKSKVHDVIFFSIFDIQTSTKIIKFVWICLLYCIVLCCVVDLKCLYSPWEDLTPCTAVCGLGVKFQVRTFAIVNPGTPLAKDCNENLIQNTTCNEHPCRCWFQMLVSFVFTIRLNSVVVILISICINYNHQIFILFLGLFNRSILARACTLRQTSMWRRPIYFMEIM